MLYYYIAIYVILLFIWTVNFKAAISEKIIEQSKEIN